MKKQAKNKPIKSFKDYPIQISIWKKIAKIEKKTLTFYDCTIVNTYKDDEDNYQTSSNFKEQDLLKTSLLIQKAYNWINNYKQEQYEESKKEDEEIEEDEETEDEE